MGSSYTNIQVRSKDQQAVIDAVQNADALPAYVSPVSSTGWVSVYPRSTEDQDDEDLKQIANQLSQNLNTGVFGLLVHDSDIFMYVLSENGTLKDQYDSDPGYFDGK